MAQVRPFMGYRPTAELAEKVAALPYDVMNNEEAAEMVKGNPYSFLHVDKAEIDLEKGIDLYDERVYQKAKENLDKMIEDKVYIQDKKPVFYIYRLTMNGESQTGLTACTSIDEYLENKIKKHELTREDKEQDRIKHVDTCNANTGPIFLTYKAKKSIDDIVNKWVGEHTPVYDFTADDGIGHTVWVVDDDDTIKNISEEFKGVDALYIADGHHRNASAVKVGLKRRKEDPNYDKNAEFNFYLSVIFPDEQLYIMDYNRVVKDLNGMSENEFKDKVSEKFDIEEYKGDGCFKPSEKHTYGMYLGKKWYKLTAKSEFINEDDVVEALDVSILQRELLSPVLGIQDPRTDKRIDFVGGIRGLEELVRRVDEGDMEIAFSMYPTSMAQLMDIADAGKIMPPKSTWFEPKLRSGIFIHKLS
ncbi:MAG: DUF1015 domain-containing protein [Firmicutes bacterium]|nr:DUF1015 domain-containing protein [Bacillota bacterium]